MRKRKYTTPETAVTQMESTSSLLNWSSPKAEDGNDTPEAKRMVYFEEEEPGNEEESITLFHFSLWDD